MRIWIGAIALACLTATMPARADMATAQQAYANGDFGLALQLWQEEADGGNADAAWFTGNMFVEGLGVPEPDYDMALIYYGLAADHDHVEAKTSIGLMYLQGLGVPQDYRQATEYLYAAALEQHPVAQVELANLFLAGVPGLVERVPGHAVEWYTLAAARGVIFAEMRLGQLHWQGIGTSVNRADGLMWMSVAYHMASSGNETYWSNRVFPLDRVILTGDEGDDPMTLLEAVDSLYTEYSEASTPEEVNLAEERALSWIAERF